MKPLFYGILLVTFANFAASESCIKNENCHLKEGCACASKESPIATSDTPQFVIVSFNDAITDLNYQNYYNPLLSGRTNPDGNPISATFYVPHEYTDYSRVNDLYNGGFEIAVHSITKHSHSEYWQTASLETLIQEFKGQRQIVSKFANIPQEDVSGARVPNFELAGDRLFAAYAQSGIKYDTTWTARNTDHFFPFTLKYKSNISCIIGSCPEGSYESIWSAPIIDLVGDKLECNNLQACRVNGSVQELSNWLYNQFLELYNDNRAPLNLVASAAWFLTNENTYQALADFLDRISKHNDVFIVSHKQVIDWMQDPVPVSSYSSVVEHSQRSCNKQACALDKEDVVRYMVSCVGCPSVYPWLGNPNGEAVKAF